MLRATRSQLQRYGVAILAAAQALFLKLLLVPQVEAENSFLLFFVAIVVSAGYGGFGPGLLAIVFSALASAYFLIPPANSWNLSWDEILWLVVFVLLGLLISVVAAAHRQAEEVLKGQARQQAAVAQLGQRALCGTDLAVLMAEAVSLAAQTLELEYCKLLELLPEGNTFLLRAGVGWPKELIGQATIGAQTNSHAGYTLLAREPVVVKDWPTEKRFNRPSLHQDHTVISGVSVIVGGQEPPFGVLGVYSPRRRDFIQDDIHFLQAIANVLAEAIRRKQDEETLQESEERFRLLVEGVQDYAIFMLDPLGRVASWNPGVERILGYQEAEIIGQDFSCFFTPEDIQNSQPEQELSQALAAGRAEDERWHVRKDGARFWATGVVTPLRDGPLRGFSKVMRDVTERKRTEEALQESNQRLQLLSETASYLLLNDQPQELVDSIFRQISAHLGLEIYFHYRVDDNRQALRLNSYGGVPDEVAKQIERLEFGQSVCGCVAAQRQQIVLENIQQLTDPETEFVRSLGTTAYACFPLLAYGRLIGTFSFGSRKRSSFNRDERVLMQTVCDQVAIALERTRLTLALQQRAEELATANRMKDDFLATLSHELRTPLNAILGWARLLRTRKFNEGTTAGALETIERNAKSQAQLIEDLLDVSRITQGNLRLNLCACELIPVIEAALSAVRPAADAQGVQLESRLDPIEPVMGDPSRLQQVVWNLLSNAIKFTPKGGRVEIKLKQLGSQVQIVVSDTGRGITADFLPYVFERFRQFDSTSTRPHGGLGLGLAIAHQLVDLHGGTVQAESQGAGQGATFTVNLPLKTAHTEPDRSKVSAQGALPWPLNGSRIGRGSLGVEVEALSGPALNGLRVLVVDDEADGREVLSTLLEQSGAKVTTVASAREALKVLKHFQVNLLVSDIGMPGEDGYALIHKVRASTDPQNPGEQIPAIALTAYASEEDRRRALAAGFQMYLTKPVEPADLVAMVKTLTGRDQV